MENGQRIFHPCMNARARVVAQRSLVALFFFFASLALASSSLAQILGSVQLNIERRAHTATLLDDGKVLIVGGDNQNGIVGQAEVFDAVAQSSSPGASLATARTDHTATLLPSGRVFIIGGQDQSSALTSSEIYNPLTASFETGPSLTTPRSGHTATVLSDGKILVAGGDATGSAELYDPVTNRFSLVTGKLNVARKYHSAALLNNGKVLIAGGVVGENTPLNSAEIYDPQTQTFTPASGAMQTPRGLALLRVLPDGKVQVIGGDGEFSMEMFDPATNSFIALAHTPPHEDYLNNIIASRTRSALITTIIQQNPVLQGQPKLTAEMIALLNRLDHTVTEIPQLNRALIAGGVNDAGQILNSATMVSSSAATITTDRFDYAPGEIVTITGQGWQPNETVWMLLHEEPETHADVIASSVADNQGNFTNTDFAPATSDAYRTFTLTAIGQTSGSTTQTAFKDSPKVGSVTVGIQTGTITYGTAGSATYTITVTRGSGSGNNGAFDATLSVTGLPAGASWSFSTSCPPSTSNCLAFKNSDNSLTSTLTITTTGTGPTRTPARATTFTVEARTSASDFANNTGTLTVNKRALTVSATGVNNVYDGTAAASVTLSDNRLAGDSLTTSFTAATFADKHVGNGKTVNVSGISISGTDSGNYTVNTTATTTANVTAKPVTVTAVTDSKTYDGNTSSMGVPTIAPPLVGGDIANFTQTYSNKNVGTSNKTLIPSGTVNDGNSGNNYSYTFVNFTTGTITVRALTVRATGINKVYDGTTTATVTLSDNRVTGDVLTTSYTSASFAPDGNVANGKTVNVSGISISGTDAGNYTFNTTATTTADITTADSTTTLSGTGSFTYDALAHAATANVTGVGSLNQSVPVVYSGACSAAPVNVAETPCTVTATFAGDANHNGSSATETITITTATPTVTVSGGPFTYDGNPHAATVTVTGVGGALVTGSTTLNYAGIPPTSYGPSTTAPTDAGTYQARALFTSSDSNYNNAQGSGSITINKAASVTTVTVAAGETFTYDASAHPATVSVTGAGGLNLTPAPVYSCGHAPIDVADSGCTASYTYAGDANHTGSSDSKTYTISKAMPTLSVFGGTFTYDGASHGATTTVAGVGGAAVSGNTTLNYAGVPPTSYGPSTTVPTNAGTYQARAVFTSSDGNYTNAQGTASVVITKADSTTTLSGTGSFTYDALAHTATANVTGAGGLNQSVPVVYSGNCSAAPISVNETPCTVTATYAGDANHNGSSASGSIIITKANASITVNGYTGVYDGFAHGATGTASGVGDVDLSILLNLGASFIHVPGGTAVWTFTGGINYNDAGGSVAIVITKADPIVTVTGNTCTYNGSPCPGSGSAIGVNGESLIPVMVAYSDAPGPGHLLTSAPVNAGTYYVAARYAGDSNYNPKQSAPATITILQASQAITVTQEPPASAYYGNNFTVAATASSGLSVSIGSSGSCSGSGSGSALITMTAGSGTCSITFDQSGDSNYQAAAQVLRNVTALNTAPVAQAQSLATSEDVPMGVTLSGSDIDNGSLTFSMVNPPAHGSLGMIGSPSCIANGIGASCTAIVTYSPAHDFNGNDSFSFKVNDGQADSNIAIVSITVNPVNDMPMANAQTVVTNDATPKDIALTGSDIETAAANLTFAIVTPPAHGELSGTPPNVTYTPFTNYKGPDYFTFTVTDRGDPDGCTIAPCSTAMTSPEATVSITVTDGTAPTALITILRPLTLSNDRDPKFGFTGTDNVTATDDLLFECKMDGGEFSPCGNPTDFTTQYFGLGDGAHTFQVRAKDQSDVTFGGGNTSAPDSYSWTIDATPPDTMIDSGPLPLSITNTATATFTFHSTENNSTFLCKVDTTVVACGGGTSTTASLIDGEHTFTVVAKDQAGNDDPSPASVTWTIDTLAPDTIINSGPANPTTGTSATFVFSSLNSPGDSYECRLDVNPAGFAPCASPVTYSSLLVGTHTFEVRGKDAAGNMETSPASYSWTIGAVTLENYTMDSDFKRFDGFDVVFGKGNQSTLKITGTNPDSFHYQIKLTNNTGTPIGSAYGNTAAAIITVPGLTSCGGVSCIGSLADPAFIVRGKKVAHVWPGHHERDEDDDDDDMPVNVKYMTLAQYQANGNKCDDNASYSSTLPANGAAKCIRITGFSIPVKHAARIRINLQFRLKGTDGWNANAQQLFYAGFVFRATTSVSFGTNVQTATDATGLVGAGKKATAIGGYAFNGSIAGSGYQVRLFTKMSNVTTCGPGAPVAQVTVDTNGFYYIWRSGQNQASSTAPSLPSGVQYAVQLCDGSTQHGLKSLDSKLREKEFEQVDFDLP